MVTIGKVLKPRGTAGEVTVMPLTSSLERFSRVCRVYIELDAGRKELRVERSRPSGKAVIVKFHGIDSPEDAERLRGRELMIPEEESPPLPEGVYYHYQIIGARVYTEGGAFIGTVKEIIETGSNDVYVVVKEGKEHLIPAIRDVIKEIDTDRRRIVIHPMEGLL